MVDFEILSREHSTKWEPFYINGNKRVLYYNQILNGTRYQIVYGVLFGKTTWALCSCRKFLALGEKVYWVVDYFPKMRKAFKVDPLTPDPKEWRRQYYNGSVRNI